MLKKTDLSRKYSNFQVLLTNQRLCQGWVDVSSQQSSWSREGAAALEGTCVLWFQWPAAPGHRHRPALIWKSPHWALLAFGVCKPRFTAF